MSFDDGTDRGEHTKRLPLWGSCQLQLTERASSAGHTNSRGKRIFLHAKPSHMFTRELFRRESLLVWYAGMIYIVFSFPACLLSGVHLIRLRCAQPPSPQGEGFAGVVPWMTDEAVHSLFGNQTNPDFPYIIAPASGVPSGTPSTQKTASPDRLAVSVYF